MESITVETTVKASVEKVWKCWTQPEHVSKWNFASDDWTSPTGANDLRVGGKFNYRMEAKDKSAGFDFEGTYTKVEPNKRIEYVMDDGRKVSVVFGGEGSTTRVTETFDAESTHPIEMQRSGWQSILDNFRKHTESC